MWRTACYPSHQVLAHPRLQHQVCHQGRVGRRLWHLQAGVAVLLALHRLNSCDRYSGITRGYFNKTAPSQRLSREGTHLMSCRPSMLLRSHHLLPTPKHHANQLGMESTRWIWKSSERHCINNATGSGALWHMERRGSPACGERA